MKDELEKKIKEKGFATTHELAKLLTVSPMTIKTWCDLEFIKCGRTFGTTMKNGHRRIGYEECLRVKKRLEY